MRLSIIIPCYNASETIGEQLAALSRQQWDHPWEVILVDNGSKDDTLKIANIFKDKIENLRIFDASKKKGASYARNIGVKKSNADFIAFCDADDVVGDQWVASMGNALFNHDFIACRMEWSKLNDFCQDTLKVKVQTEKLIPFFVDGFFPHAGGGSLGIRRKIHLDVGGFNENLRYLEDTDYCWKVQSKGYELKFIPDAVIHIRAKETNFGIFKQEMKWAEYDYFMYQKYKSDGTAEFKLKKSVRSLYYLMRSFNRFLSPEQRCTWIIKCAIELGRIEGGLKFRLFEHKLIKGEAAKVLL